MYEPLEFRFTDVPDPLRDPLGYAVQVARLARVLRERDLFGEALAQLASAGLDDPEDRERDVGDLTLCTLVDAVRTVRAGSN